MALAKIMMEYCNRCKERWFKMRLRGEVCHNCFNRDEKRKDYKKDETPFLMSMENKMDPGEIPAFLPKPSDRGDDYCPLTRPDES